MNSTPVVTEVRPERPPSAATRSGLDKGGDGRNAHKAASCSRHGVDNQNGADVLDIAVLGEELACLATAIAVPMVSKKSLMSREKRQ